MTSTRLREAVGVIAVGGFVALAGCGDDDASTLEREDPSERATVTTPVVTATSDTTTTSGPAVADSTSLPPEAADLADLEHPTGFRLSYPPGWSPAGLELPSEFAQDAECASVKIVDRAPPPESGGAQAPSIEQSVVQVCSRPADGSTLEEFMRTTYGADLAGFEATTLAGHPAYGQQSREFSIFFLDAGGRRYQVRTSVVAAPELESTRLAEVEQILQTLTID
ncbi:MAG: hypothetical protein ACRD0G_06680 [Acidimicrobiales bacterium]